MDENKTYQELNAEVDALAEKVAAQLVKNMTYFREKYGTEEIGLVDPDTCAKYKEDGTLVVVDQGLETKPKEADIYALLALVRASEDMIKDDMEQNKE